MSPKEGAKYLQFSEIGFYKLLQEKKIPGAFKIGSRWKIRKEHLDEYIEKALALSVEKTALSPEA